MARDYLSLLFYFGGLISTASANDRIGVCAEDDCDHGKGVFEYENGDVYYGGFAALMRHGNGICAYNVSNETNLSGFRKYDGEWSLDLFDGKGELELVDGTTFKGFFKEGKLHGEHPSRATYGNGSFYEGQFFHGKFHGRGAWMDTDDKGTTYLGDWSNGQMHGEGVYELADGYMYNGTFVHGKRTGKAVIKYAASRGGSTVPSTYEGELVDGQRHGMGKYRESYMNGVPGAWWEYNGLWEGDEMVEKDITVNPTGSQNPDDWELGTLSDSGEPVSTAQEEEKIDTESEL